VLVHTVLQLEYTQCVPAKNENSCFSGFQNATYHTAIGFEVEVEFKVPPNTNQAEMLVTINHLTDTNKQNCMGKYTN